MLNLVTLQILLLSNCKALSPNPWSPKPLLVARLCLTGYRGYQEWTIDKSSKQHFSQLDGAGGPWSGWWWVMTHREGDREIIRGVLTHRDRAGKASVTAWSVK